ncbi:MAG: hypothetical protein COA54_02330 [Thiotrichaceae bacterium]|nr:MAG: hypothetical protein COA54_02330 [Thiotrichaceae bacterium]
MKTSILILAITLIPATASADNNGFRQCAAWDTFCKSPAQIVATKCRLGVPVKHEQCEALGIPGRYMIRGGGSLVEGLPVTTQDTDQSTDQVLADYI